MTDFWNSTSLAICVKSGFTEAMCSRTVPNRVRVVPVLLASDDPITKVTSLSPSDQVSMVTRPGDIGARHPLHTSCQHNTGLTPGNTCT